MLSGCGIMQTDTIFALSSGRLPAGVAVIRISGPKVRFAFETIFGAVPPPRQMSYGSFRKADRLIIDRGLAVFFPAPFSFTGEDCGEFHVHGSRAVVRALSEVLSGIENLRQAEPGEFTRRAFIHGKLDLTQAEGLADLIASETEAQRRLALLQTEGQLLSLYNGWRKDLVNARAMVEAAIDFSEEDDVAGRALASLSDKLSAISGEISRHLSGYRQAEIVREGFNVVILGAPNSGKSTLINALAGRDVAIASDEAGTTRDLIDVRLDLSGNLIVVTDTAGLRENAGHVESIGIAKARSRAALANLILLVEDVVNPQKVELGVAACPVIRLGNKADCAESVGGDYDFLISAKNGDGISRLLDYISVQASDSAGYSDLFVVQERQAGLLAEARLEIEKGLDARMHLDFLAEHLRLASGFIGKLTGQVDVEELLGVIFSKFCIGK